MNLRYAVALVLAFIAAASAVAQHPTHEPSVEDVHERMRELMGKVETRLDEIDSLLNDASSRAKAASNAAELDRVLVVSRKHAQQNLDDIDEILRLSKHEHPQGQPGSSAGT